MPSTTPIVDNPPMPNYTHLNLNDVENQAPNFGPGVTRNVEAGPEGVEYLAFGAPAVESKREEANMQPGWWQD